MTKEALKSCVVEFHKAQTALQKPMGGTFVISRIGTTTVGGETKEGFQYSGQFKYVPFDTLYECYAQMLQTGKLTREWFKTTFATEYAGRPCNYTIIGSILVKLNIAQYVGNGTYRKID